MGFNDPEAAKLGPKVRGVVGASMPSRRPGDPRHYRSEAPLLSERMLGEGLYLTNDGRVAVDFDLVERVSALRAALDVVLHAEADSGAQDTTPPAADRFLFNSPRHVAWADLTLYKQVLLQVYKAGTAGAVNAAVHLRYATAYSGTESDYAQIGSAPVRVAINTTNTLLKTDWIDLVHEALTEDGAYLTLIHTAGNSAASPFFGRISATFRR